MASRLTRRRSNRLATRRERLAMARFELPAAFESSAAEADPARTPGLWAALAAAETPAAHAAAREALAVHYLPLVVCVACFYKRTRGDKAPEELDELVSDGCEALLRALDCETLDPSRDFKRYATQAIISAFWQARKKRTWGGYVKSPRSAALQNWRKRFTRANGRVPTREESDAFAATLIDNPAVQVGDRPRPLMLDATSLRNPRTGSDPTTRALADDDGPLVAMIRRETVALAMKGLSGADLQAFRMLMAGEPMKAVQRRFGLTDKRARQWCNGLLWRVRKQAELAAGEDGAWVAAGTEKGTKRATQPAAPTSAAAVA